MLKKVYLILDAVIGVLIIALIIILIVNRTGGGNYYQDSYKAFQKAEEFAAGWDGTDPKKLNKLYSLCRNVFEMGG